MSPTDFTPHEPIRRNEEELLAEIRVTQEALEQAGVGIQEVVDGPGGTLIIDGEPQRVYAGEYRRLPRSKARKGR